jgi:hypothetical protein
MSARKDATISVAVAEAGSVDTAGPPRMTRDDVRAYLDRHSELHKSCQLVRDAGETAVMTRTDTSTGSISGGVYMLQHQVY